MCIGLVNTRSEYLYSSIFPVIIMLNSIRNSVFIGIREVYFGCANDKFGGCGSVMSLHESSSSDDLTG